MTILLVDSADEHDVAQAVELGLARGATTNPKLMRAVTDRPLEQLAVLLELPLVQVYYQPTGAYGPDLAAEAERAHALAPGRVVVKAMATPAGTALAMTLYRRGIPVALTGVQSAQAMAAAIALGCHAVIPYHDRGLKDPAVSDTLIADLVAVRGQRPGPAVIAASIKTGGQLVDALVLGADSVSAPAHVLRSLTAHPSSLAAEREFTAQYAAGGTERGAAGAGAAPGEDATGENAPADASTGKWERERERAEPPHHPMATAWPPTDRTPPPKHTPPPKATPHPLDTPPPPPEPLPPPAAHPFPLVGPFPATAPPPGEPWTPPDTASSPPTAPAHPPTPSLPPPTGPALSGSPE